jgi:cytidine deaminase
MRTIPEDEDGAAHGPGPHGAQPPVEADFADLLEAARAIARRAYAPYSRFAVGAAALADDGRVVTGCNVENAGYGVTLCAECGLISQLVAGGGGRLRRFVCVGGSDEAAGGNGPADDDAPGDRHPAAGEGTTDGERPVVMPCGRCRQLLSEHAAPDLAILTPEGPRTLSQILPQAFGPSALASSRRPR